MVNFHAETDVQQRLDDLAGGANDGTLSAVEQGEYESYVEAIDVVAVLQAIGRASVYWLRTKDDHRVRLRRELRLHGEP